ncbi:hypothetical protein K492DRAFT_194128 [Lichtheimia hyalospora FSU 10163]|nr:hypothetical protein K492DRAFT_194128 [Lichtheimia hyalospora FSU 10163]
MKIKKTTSKKLAPLPQPLRDIIYKLQHDAEETIPELAKQLNEWPYRRGDMFHWVPVLDRFDVILERICNDFHLQQHVQSREFDSNTKTLLLAITSILKVLFEHCTNRNIYNSFEHINALLNSMDIDVLENIMQFMLKPAQRLNQPSGMASSFAAPQDKMIEMARNWGFPTSDLVHLISNEFIVTKDMTTLHMRFYHSSDNKEQQQSDEGVIDFTVNVASDAEKSDIQIFQELSKQYDIPNEYHFELAHQIRVKRNLASVEPRRKLLKIRILAIAIMELTVSESTASNQIFMQEPHLIAGLGELVHPEKNIDYDLQICSLRSLAAIAENRRTINDVLTAMNASANHGVFLRILRMISNGTISDYPWQYLDALFMTLSSILNSHSGMQMLVSAGLVPALTQLLGNSQAVTNKSQSKIIAVLDGIMHGSSSSFATFCNIGGLDTLLGRIKDEVVECLEYSKSHPPTATELLEPDVFELQKTTGILELYDRISALRAMLRFLWRMMDSSGTTDRLRNLVESSILSSLVSVVSEPYVFGSHCFVSATNIMTTIIHSEPTSLSILQEAKLPQTFLDTICKYDNPSNDVLMPAVNAFGAICLNPQGIDMFKEANPLPHFFDLISDREYPFNSDEPDIMTGLGNTFDELVRHHPSLKSDVIACIKTMVKRVIDMGQSHDENIKSKNDGHLLKIAPKAHDETATKDTRNENIKEEKSENRLVLFIDRTARFLEGFLQNHSNIRAAIKEGLPDLLLDFYALPALPADFSTTAASDCLAFVIKIINDVNMSNTILEIAKRVRKASQFISEDMVAHTSSMLRPLVDLSDNDTNQFEAGNALFRKFIILHGYIGLLSDISYSAGLSLGRSSSSLVAELLSGDDENINTIELVGIIYRFTMWENFLLKESVPSHWYNFNHDKGNEKHASTLHLVLGRNGNNHASNSRRVSNDENNRVGDSQSDLSGKENIDAKDPRIQNLRYFKLFLGEMTHSIMVLLQSLITMTCSRRTMDADQKAVTFKLSRSIAELLKRNVLWMRDASNPKKLPMCKHNYRTVMYSMVSLLFLEDRPQASLYTPAVVAFDWQGGTDMLLHDLDSLWQKISLLHMVPSTERTKEQQTLVTHMYGSLEALLTALACIGSSKLLRDSPYTAPIVKRGNKSSHSFDPYGWIISMQLKLTPIQQYLHTPDAKEFPKHVLQVLLKIVLHAFKGDGEANFHKETVTTAASTFRIPPFQQRNRAPNPTILRVPPVVADQNGVQQLVDMGFDRSASELAMVRCHNQISRAVDFLFTYPGERPADTNIPENTTTTTRHQSNNVNDDTANDDTANDDTTNDDTTNDDTAHDDTAQQEAPDSQDIFESALGDGDSDFDDSDDEFNDWRHQILGNINRTRYTSSRPTQQDPDSGDTEEEKKMVHEQTQKLIQVRAKMKTELPSILVQLACRRDDLLFDIRDLLLAFFKSDSDTKTASAVISLVIDRVDEIRQQNQDENAQLGTYLLLLALLFKEPIVQDVIVNVTPRLEFLFGLIQSVDTSDPEKPLPSWLATVLLVIETLISQADEPKHVSSATQDGTKASNNSTPLVSVDQCHALLIDCIKLLRSNDITRNDIYAILRILVRLTRDYDSAREFAKHDGLQLLFAKARSRNHGGNGLQGLQAFIIIIFRHIIESKAVLGKRMEDIISTWFTVPRPRNMDIRTYLRNNGHVALRDPSTFLNVSGQICRITRYDRHSENPHIKLLSKNSISQDENEMSIEKNATVSEEIRQQHEHEIADASIVIDYLLNELIRACKNSHDGDSSSITIDHRSTTENSHYAYTGFILQCLVELVSSYNTCKHALYAFCQHSDNKDDSIMHMLINDLLPYNAVNPNVESRKQQGLSIWTASIIVAMCYDAGGANNETNPTVDKDQDLDPIRRYIFDIIVCAFKDTIASTQPGSLSVKYAKYLALADLCHRILNARPSAGAPAQQRTKEETTIHIAKLMINKELISVLTMAINDIDIEYPHARTVVNSMLRPLEQLTSFGSKMTDTEQQDKDNETNLEQQSLLQDTAHLYRDPSPGIFNNGDVEEQMDEPSNGDRYGEDDFDDSTTDDSSDIPPREDDDVEVIDMLEQDAMEEENGNQMQVDGGNAAESTVQEEDDEPHMAWQLEDFDHESIIRGTGDIEAPESPLMNGRRNYRDLVDVLVDNEHVDDLDALDQSDFDEEDGSENLDDVNDGLDLMEDRAMMEADMDEDYYLGGEDDRDNRFSRSLPRIDLQRTDIRRSTRLPILPLPRGLFRPLGVTATNTADQDQVINHPLLSEEYQGTNGLDSNNMVSRPTRSSFAGPIAYSRPRPHGGQSMWQAFEHTVGNSAIRLLESYLMRAASGTSARRGIQSSSLGFDVRGRANDIMRSFELELRNNPSRIINNNTMTCSPLEEQEQPDVDSNRELLSMLHDFQPMTCADRWNQEARMMYGTSVADKSQNLLNSLLNILVPILMEEERRMREKEEQRREEERRLQEERRKKEEEEQRRREEEERKRKEHDDSVQEEHQSTATIAANGSDMDTSAPIQGQDQHQRMITINGELVDISQTGLDIEFLEALPDDLRREVVNDHMRISRSRTQVSETESISSEFLGALPPEIRDEVIQQEAFSRERRERQQQQEQQPADTPLPQVLNGHAPSPLGLPDPPTHRFRLSDEFQRLVTEFGRNGNATREDTNQRKNNTRQNALQLVDRGELASLARLLFALQPISKSILCQLLVNLCENTQTRCDLLSLLVCVLHDGSNDLTAVDRSFYKVIQSSSSSKLPDNNVATTPTTQTAPNFITQRCLGFLMQLIQSNDKSIGYFLVENDCLADLKRNSTSKGKNKMHPLSSKYPLLVLISLLDRPVFVDNPSLMEDLMRLISTLCRPFPILVKKYMDRANSTDNGSKELTSKPPVIPDQYLQQVVHVLVSGECSSKTFQCTISALSYLSTLDGAMQTIMRELMQGAKSSYEHVASDLDDLLIILNKATPDTELQGSTLSQFSGASSHQAKLLRVLKTIDYVYSRKSNTPSSQYNDNKEQSVLGVYEELALLSLWNKLGDCLVAIRERDYLLNVATVILPLMESLMVVYKYAADQAQEGFFFAFTERHRKILNTMVRNNPSLMLGSFSLLVRNPKVLEFDNKRNYFVQQLHKRTSTPRQHYPSLQLNVRRQYVFQDSYHQLLGKTGDEIKYGRLNVQFREEDGMDAGGVSREWYSVLARQMFDPNYALFITSAADKLTYQPNRASSVNPDHLSYLKFVGRVIGKAIYDGRLLDAYFTRSFYKHILGRSVDYKDMEAIDHEYYKSLVWMLENDITDVIDLTFSLEVDDFGTTHIIDLKPDGRNLPVTEENKHEYVSLVTEHRLTTAIKDQIEAFLQGFHEIIPASLIQIFNEQELELLISGLPDIDIDDWKNNTEYQGGYSSNSAQIQWFWRAVRSFDQEERAKLLQFATGTSKVPLDGFANLQGSGGVQKFQIHKEYSSDNRLPTAHTCFNQIDLPMYDSYSSLRQNLFKAINECATGFGFV